MSQDEEDESEFVVQTVQKAVEAKAKSSYGPRTMVPLAPLVWLPVSTTSMGIALGTMFLDDKTERNVGAYNSNDATFHIGPAYNHTYAVNGASKRFSVRESRCIQSPSGGQFFSGGFPGVLQQTFGSLLSLANRTWSDGV
ncbi:uncharacterized protein BT62DRAFT_937789 [Guyanagaster necrorhizus]|uniref:Uncharacterized protein n=1 Tax=Guyanagaster necrorhizus TaxID=856835 RepID=A0A9P7VIM4_9AGAR|nr:uncharacterized protein BT62DRAFT_937789 [Guyanagaster necrorhizus MCA 3950]KAG7440639.1 hypothetical protein BT62DRAFT_937789 [Guyanagaster necrorhizus MCA 3950]